MYDKIINNNYKNLPGFIRKEPTKMYKKNEAIYPVKDDTLLWKYMSFSKFVNLLSGNLYFNRIDSFEDVFECHFTDKTRSVLESSQFSELLKAEPIAQHIIYVSCFHASEYETAFMWHQYSDQDGLAVQTTGKRLKDAFNSTKELIFLSEVKYLDYNTDYFDPSNLFRLAIHKRKSFEFEKEVRCICMKTPEGLKENQSLLDVETPIGIKIPINLDMLIDKIYLSPYAPSYLEENVKMIMDKWELHKDVINSNLYTIK